MENRIRFKSKIDLWTTLALALSSLIFAGMSVVPFFFEDSRSDIVFFVAMGGFSGAAAGI